MYKDLRLYEEYISNISEGDEAIDVIVTSKATYKVNMEIKRILSKKTDKKINIKLEQKKRITTPVTVFMSGKGGVGKSYVTKLYTEEKSRKEKVLLIDLDIYGYSIPKLFNVYGETRLEDSKIIPVKASEKLDIISSQYFIKDMENVAIMWRGPKLNQLTSLMLENIDMDNYDRIIIDTPPTTGDAIMNLGLYFNNISAYIITTPKELDQHVALRSLDIAKQLGFIIKGFIINQAFYTYNNEDLFIWGQKYDAKIGENIKAVLAINDEEENKKRIEEMEKNER